MPGFPKTDSLSYQNRLPRDMHNYVEVNNDLRTLFQTMLVTDRQDVINALPWSPIHRRPRITNSLDTDHSRCIKVVVMMHNPWQGLRAQSLVGTKDHM